MADFLGIITAEEIEILRRSRREGAIHPVVTVALRHRDGKATDLTAYNTEAAARLIASKNPQWLKALHPRLTATDDFTHASSALGEIRAYGALLETWVTVRPSPKIPGSNVSPEFEIDNKDGEVIVEVHSRQLDEEQAASLDNAAKELKKRHSQNVKEAHNKPRSTKNTVTLSITEVFPTGTPKTGKKGDFVLTNTISKIAAIKQNEKQLDKNKPFILWLDLQDSGVWALPLAEQLFSPLYSELRDGRISSGPFWFALYGRKNDPLIELRGFDYRSTPMAHDGRFYQTMASHGGPTRVSAVVFPFHKRL